MEISSSIQLSNSTLSQASQLQDCDKYIVGSCDGQVYCVGHDEQDDDSQSLKLVNLQGYNCQSAIHSQLLKFEGNFSFLSCTTAGNVNQPPLSLLWSSVLSSSQQFRFNCEIWLALRQVRNVIAFGARGSKAHLLKMESAGS